MRSYCTVNRVSRYHNICNLCSTNVTRLAYSIKSQLKERVKLQSALVAALHKDWKYGTIFLEV